MSHEYPPTRGPVLLLTCMDLRLMDDVVDFMDDEGLTNRYDHIALAGAALGALGAQLPKYKHWWKTFEDHLDAAYDLRQFKDVIIIEHRDCGAYKKLVGLEFDDDQLQQEAAAHLHYTQALVNKIDNWAKQSVVQLSIKSFLMDLRGDVVLLEGPIRVGKTSKMKKSPAKKASKKKSSRKK